MSALPPKADIHRRAATVSNGLDARILIAQDETRSPHNRPAPLSSYGVESLPPEAARAAAISGMFPRYDGQIRSPHWLTQKFALLMDALKIEGVTFHSLRHTHASQLIASGMDVLTISRSLGHGSPTITLSVYGHLLGNTDARAAEIMEATFADLRTD